MIVLELKKSDASVLREILDSALLDMKTERVRTENRAYHDELSRREAFLGGLIRQLGIVEEQ